MTTTCGSNGKFIVGGNWKCNGTLGSVKTLISELNAGKIDADVEVVCAPAFVHIAAAQAGLSPHYQVAAQNCWTGAGGAFTGEVSAEMLKDAGIPWVVLGHSERRQLCGETNEEVAIKVKYALGHGLKVMACIGETLDQREAGTTLNVCEAQLAAIAKKINVMDWKNVVVAYEPVWAIGTGKVATPEQAQEVHAGIRKFLAKKVSPGVAAATRIQYGGSVNAGNCDTLAAMDDIDGFLVGGASLKGDDFVTICNSAKFSARVKA
jgi:triosephosphate isomerase